MKAHIISIGDEILIGQIVNTNTVNVAKWLNLQGIIVQGMTTVGDTPEAIVEVLDYTLKQADIIIITGGLGPTKDDLTKEVLANYFNMPLVYHEETFQNIVTLFAGFGRIADGRYRLQSYMPEGATILINKQGTASGMWFEQNGKIVVSLPGVPREMTYLMQAEVLPRLQTKFPSKNHILHHTLHTIGMGETDMSELLEEFETKILPAHIKLAYLPDTFSGTLRLRLSAVGEDKNQLESEIQQYDAYLKEKLGLLIFGYGETSLEIEVGKLLQAKGATLSLAESCTGGRIAQRITSVSGASAYFMGSAVTYSNELKHTMLNVKTETIARFGAVSKETVREMAQGALYNMNTDYTIAVSGIAGPNGGSEAKPIGTMWIAAGSCGKLYSKKYVIGTERALNIERGSSYALNLLRLILLDAPNI